jgi:Flp pilus assembly pilin Flp
VPLADFCGKIMIFGSNLWGTRVVCHRLCPVRLV